MFDFGFLKGKAKGPEFIFAELGVARDFVIPEMVFHVLDGFETLEMKDGIVGRVKLTGTRDIPGTVSKHVGPLSAGSICAKIFKPAGVRKLQRLLRVIGRLVASLDKAIFPKLVGLFLAFENLLHDGFQFNLGFHDGNGVAHVVGKREEGKVHGCS